MYVLRKLKLKLQSLQKNYNLVESVITLCWQPFHACLKFCDIRQYFASCFLLYQNG